jgi:hypothetical protein
MNVRIAESSDLEGEALPTCRRRRGVQISADQLGRTDAPGDTAGKRRPLAMKRLALSAISALLCLMIGTPSRSQDLSSLDLTSPERHCNQQHNHSALPWSSLASCDWQRQLEWCSGDTGFNEGAAVATSVALQAGLDLPGPVANLGGGVIGNLWKRRDMMAFAKSLARGLNPNAAALAIACQWHNCHALKCLAAHPVEVQEWLRTH